MIFLAFFIGVDSFHAGYITKGIKIKYQTHNEYLP